MIPVLIDTSTVAAEFSLSSQDAKDMVSFVVKELTARFAKSWDDEAKRALKSTRQLYRSSLVVGEQGPFTGYVMLVNKLSNMIESGASPFDIKVGFARSSKAKRTAGGGWYLTVPFRHATPGALGENEVFSNIMPTSVYAVAKKLEPTVSTLGGVKRGGSLQVNQIPSPHNIPRTRAMIVTKSKTFEEYKHKHSIYEGMQRSQKTYEKATQGSYVTFRRVSSNSDKNSWIHKGIEARRLSDKALANTNIPHEVDMAVDNFLTRLGF